MLIHTYEYIEGLNDKARVAVDTTCQLLDEIQFEDTVLVTFSGDIHRSLDEFNERNGLNEPYSTDVAGKIVYDFSDTPYIFIKVMKDIQIIENACICYLSLIIHEYTHIIDNKRIKEVIDSDNVNDINLILAMHIWKEYLATKRATTMLKEAAKHFLSDEAMGFSNYYFKCKTNGFAENENRKLCFQPILTHIAYTIGVYSELGNISEINFNNEIINKYFSDITIKMYEELIRLEGLDYKWDGISEFNNLVRCIEMLDDRIMNY